MIIIIIIDNLYNSITWFWRDAMRKQSNENLSTAKEANRKVKGITQVARYLCAIIYRQAGVLMMVDSFNVHQNKNISVFS